MDEPKDNSYEIMPWELMSSREKIQEYWRLEEELLGFDTRFLAEGMPEQLNLDSYDVAKSYDLYNLIMHLWRSENKAIERYNFRKDADEDPCAETANLKLICDSALWRKECQYWYFKDENEVKKYRLSGSPLRQVSGAGVSDFHPITRARDKKLLSQPATTTTTMSDSDGSVVDYRSDSSDEIKPWETQSSVERILEVQRLDHTLYDYDENFLGEGTLISSKALRAIHRIAIDIKEQGFFVRDVAHSFELYRLITHLWDSENEAIRRYNYLKGADREPCSQTMFLKQMRDSALRFRECTYRDSVDPRCD
ncbi:hypothetical protein BDN70DRAFT_899177 [Pholiota conissans]|uniref:Uncharacterized protein n=1 Tax=Pholiota conissans TaxID=109636 RepID=A0A9P5YT98_9AGAR|nr:hypothetical protein BDN70DRAFT_899177 [Pholiota conissans]